MKGRACMKKSKKLVTAVLSLMLVLNYAATPVSAAAAEDDLIYETTVTAESKTVHTDDNTVTSKWNRRHSLASLHCLDIAL